VLRGQTPEMVRKEVWAHLLAYNLVRGLMAQAAHEAQALPLEISFKGALQALNAFADVLLTAPARELEELTAPLPPIVARSHLPSLRPSLPVRPPPPPHPAPRRQAPGQVLRPAHRAPQAGPSPLALRTLGLKSAPFTPDPVCLRLSLTYTPSTMRTSRSAPEP